MDKMSMDIANGKFKNSLDPEKAMHDLMDSMMTDMEEMGKKMKTMKSMMTSMKGHK